MGLNAEIEKIITHDFPVWREKADFIIGLHLAEPGIADLASSEQIWARRIDENLFEVCCIPFFAYGVALGDFVRTRDDGVKKYIIDDVVKNNGHTTYRILFRSTDEWHSTIDEIRELGCFVEVRWEKSSLIAVDAPDAGTRARLEPFLSILEKTGQAICEVDFRDTG